MAPDLAGSNEVREHAKVPSFMPNAPGDDRRVNMYLAGQVDHGSGRGYLARSAPFPYLARDQRFLGPRVSLLFLGILSFKTNVA